MFAKVVIESPLPQLDRVFEYKIPDFLESICKPGVRVKVTLGKSKKHLDAYVLEVNQTPEFQGPIAQLSEVVSSAQVLDESLFSLLRALADRQASTVGELLRSAIPNRSVAVEEKYLAHHQSVKAPDWKRLPTECEIWLIQPSGDFHAPYEPIWASSLVQQAIRDSEKGSVLLCVPDQKDLEIIKSALSRLDKEFIDFSSAQTPSKRYAAFLKALSSKRKLIIGNRNVLLAPVRDLASIIIWNEADFSHTDQASPYLTSRDIGLVRQSLHGGLLRFASLSLSTEAQRLISMGFAKLRDDSALRPKLVFDSDLAKSESLAHKTLKSALTKGPALVQVSALGQSVSVFCKSCTGRLFCNQCSGPLWLNPAGKALCRWCNALNYSTKCSNCGSSEIKAGRGGVTRSVAELAKAFPGIRVIESSSSTSLEKVGSKPVLVVATPGSEPVPENGYEAVVLMDARNQLARDSLRATEDAVSAWANACALLSKSGTGVLVGVAGKLAEQFVLWKQIEIATDQLADRGQLNLPPMVRLGSITGEALAALKASEIAKETGAEVFGPTTIENQQVQYIFKYPYKLGTRLSAEMKMALMLTGAGVNSRSNRNQRLVRVKMDDRQVI